MSKKTPVMSHDPLSGLDDENSVTSVGTDSESPTESDQAAQGGIDVVPAATPEGPFGLSDSLTIADVEEVHKALKGRLENDDALDLDGSDIEMVDGAGLQLLVALFKEATERQKTVRWHAVSDALRRDAEIMGVAERLLLDESEAA